MAVDLESVARALVPPGKGILAADESHPTIARRFAALGIENTAETRRLYRQMLFTTPGLVALRHHRVALEAMLLKASMVLAGKSCPRQAGGEEVAAATIRCLRRAVPAAVPGIVFLSGGQTEVLATAHLNAMNARGGPQPWALSFSYGRALQDAAMRAWQGSATLATAGQQALHRRARCNGAARDGRYVPGLAHAAA